MTFGVFHAKLPAAVRSVLQRPRNHSVQAHRAGMSRIRIRNDKVYAPRFNAAQLIRRLEAAPKFFVLPRAKHDHSPAQPQLSMRNASVFALMYGVTFKSKYLAKPVDCGWGISITMSGNDGTVCFSHGNLLQQVSGESGRKTTQSYILARMGLPAGDNQLVQIMGAALADAASRAGAWLVCRPGCTQCCYGAFAINELDAQRLATGMQTLRTENPNLAANLQRRAKTWIGEHGPNFPGDPQTGRLGDTEADRARFEDYANDAACPALDPATGLCDIYEWRPMTCRVFGPPVRIDSGTDADDSTALGHCELCFTGATTAEIATCEMPIPHELEQKLLNQISPNGETIVAFALLR